MVASNPSSPTPAPEAFQRPSERLRVLAIDDSEDDLFFLSRAIERDDQFTCVATLTSGEAALSYFQRQNPFEDPLTYPDPHLVLLDLKMPRINGFEILSFLGTHVPQRRFKVVVLSSSDAPSDVEQSRQLGADGFETKPTDPSGYARLVQRLGVMLQ